MVLKDLITEEFGSGVCFVENQRKNSATSVDGKEPRFKASELYFNLDVHRDQSDVAGSSVRSSPLGIQ